MQFEVLGPLRADAAGQDRTPTGALARNVLAVLLLRREQAVHPEVLLDLVWGNQAVHRSPAVVHTIVARLRRRLGPDTVQTTGTGYRLLGSTDADRFSARLAEAREAARADAAAAIGALRDGLALWRGDTAYDGVRDDLVAPERRRLHDLREGAVELLARLLIDAPDAGASDEAGSLLAGLLTRDPLRESAHELRMLAAWRAGRQADALAAYGRLQRLLRKELGIDPGPSAAALHRRILAQDATLSTGREGPSRPWRGLAAPAPATAMVGRDADLARIEELRRARRVVLLIGPAGVGKSRLLGEVVRRATGSGSEAVFVDLGHLDEVQPAVVAQALARMLDVRPGSDPLASLIAAMADHEVLLGVDQAEGSPSAIAAVVAGLVAGAPRLRVLIASRRDLALAGAARHLLAPLPCPAPEAGPRATALSPAVRLLRERIIDHAPDLRLEDDEDVRVLGQLARRVDGLPLALELLAGYAGSHHLSQLQELTRVPLQLRSTEAGRPVRHRSLRETVSWSIQRLEPADLEVLRRLGVFQGSFDMAAAVAVGQGGPGAVDVEPRVRALVRDALVQVQRGPRGIEFRLLSTVREVALEALTAAGEHADARRRHRSWHAARWRGELRSDALLADVREHYVDYLGALRSALEDHDGSTVADLTVTLSRLWLFTDLLEPGLRWLQLVLDSGLANEADAARIRTLRASLAVHHDTGLVRAELARALPVLQAEQDHSWLVTAHMIDALERFEGGDYTAALAAATCAVQAAGSTTGERQADALGVLALTEAAAGHEGAADTVARARSLAQASGSTASVASVAANVAWALLALHRPHEARALLEHAASARGPGAVPLFLVGNLAWADLACGDAGRAAAGFAHAVGASSDNPADRGTADVYVGAGCALAGLASPGAAEVLTGACRLVMHSALTLMPWQQALLTAALVSAGVDPDAASNTSPVPFARLRELIRTDAAAPTFQPPEWWPQS